MVTFQNSVVDLIKNRYSCRSYLPEVILQEKQNKINAFFEANSTGPTGSKVRFLLAAATENNREEIKGLGTYGTIKGATGFILGVVGPGVKNLEDFGYLMEKILLFFTDLDLGTVWLGGFFTRSTFAKKIGVDANEILPAVAATGIPDESSRKKDFFRKTAGSDRRFSWEHLFFDRDFGASLSKSAAQKYALPLEMLRLSPSASNKQPWRVIRDPGNNAWQFYVQRTPGYAGGFAGKMVGIADLQRVDLGIGMCHFELTCKEQGLSGKWTVADPGIDKPDHLTEYIISWVPE
jgi:hypothetical protein